MYKLKSLSKIQFIFCSIIIFFLTTTKLCAKSFIIDSPNNIIKTSISINDQGNLYYNVEFGGMKVIENSKLGILINDQKFGSHVSIKNIIRKSFNERYETRLKESEVINYYNEGRLEIVNLDSKQSFYLEVRVFDDGFAFRYHIPGKGKQKVSGEITSFNLPGNCTIWYQDNPITYEGEYIKISSEMINSEFIAGPPITVKLLDDNGYMAITEANLRNYSGMALKGVENRMLQACFPSDPESWNLKNDVVTPWRLIKIGKNLNDLYNNDMIFNLNPEPDKQLFPDGDKTEWIKPGRCVWSWMSDERNDGVIPEKMKLYAKLASQLDVKYNMIDEGWGHWKEPGKDKWDILEEVIEESEKYGVKTWIWKACPDRQGIPGIYDKKTRVEFFKRCADLGVVGVKLDFMDSEAQNIIQFQEQTLQDAARFKLMVDFHGANKPTGLERTYPNEMTREGIKGLEHGKAKRRNTKKWAFHNTVLPFTRFLAGHADYTPISFRQFPEGTSWAHQLASAIIFSSELLVFGESPQTMLAHPTAQILKSIPAVYDETIVLPMSEIGEVAAFAKRKDNDWFIAIINGQEETTVELDLSFLPEKFYEVQFYDDNMKNDQGISIAEQLLFEDIQIPVTMRSGGGFVAWFKDASAKIDFKRHTALNKNITIMNGTNTEYQKAGAVVDGFLNQAQDYTAMAGVEGRDFQCIIDLGEKVQVNKLMVRCAQCIESWIFLPEYVEYSVSINGEKYKNVGKIVHQISDREANVIHNFVQSISNENLRYIKVYAKYNGPCPEWHQGAGGKSWIFVDEIIIE